MEFELESQVFCLKLTAVPLWPDQPGEKFELLFLIAKILP